jgi:hypothetical protein
VACGLAPSKDVGPHTDSSSAAQAAAPVLAGTLYERYYGLPLERVAALDDIEKQRCGTPSSPGFAALCAELAGATEDDEWSVARHGTIIEQAQILTTHNLAQLVDGLDLVDELRPAFPELARRCFERICTRQQLAIDDWRAELQRADGRREACSAARGRSRRSLT